MTTTKNIHDRINLALSQTLKSAKESPAPPKLAAAIDYAVFPGGARVRPRLCLAVAQACGEDFLEIGESAAAAIECHSLATEATSSASADGAGNGVGSRVV